MPDQQIGIGTLIIRSMTNIEQLYIIFEMSVALRRIYQ